MERLCHLSPEQKGDASQSGGSAITFDEILAQILDLLQREKRVSYRALKRRFDLDDEYLEDLKEEIIKAKRLASDEEGSVLIWTGDPQRVASYPAQPESGQEERSRQGESPPPATRLLAAERRQLTVMFCDLVESTALSSQLDPEDLRDIVRAYQQVCSDVVTRFDGHVAQLLGDGLLVYFGYPQAHEDDAQRAVRTGLGIIEVVEALNTSLEAAKGITLAVRLGIHTGRVVVSEMGGVGRQEQLALGEAPNITSRIQGLAEPNTLVICHHLSREQIARMAVQIAGGKTFHDEVLQQIVEKTDGVPLFVGVLPLRSYRR
jgi:class 3 adenylate cyclase